MTIRNKGSQEITLGFLFAAATVGTNEDWPTLCVALSSYAGAKRGLTRHSAAFSSYAAAGAFKANNE